jgi:glutamate--cysteine ligase
LDIHELARFNKLLDSGQEGLLRDGLKGIEKESLRISKNGFIAQTDHPAALGSALAHPFITTDYSEALLEFITPPFSNINDMLEFMENIHRFVYLNLDDELLLSASMPCGIDGDESIRIAEYGASNIGKMKHVYRRGLWYRYGRAMQSIAGIHFNYSVPEALWPILHDIDKDKHSKDQYIANAYFGLIRNFLRQGWIILYLFGASPAICRSFFKGREQVFSQFDNFDRYTLYHPYATSLRMSDIGYKSTNQANLNIDYNTLGNYVTSLAQAIETPYAEYEKIGVKVNGEYRQLNSNALQIENEFYSTIRPKQIAKSCEKPTLALKRRGVQYIEIRSLDLNLFEPIGINADTARFLEAFLLTCLFQESPYSYDQERLINNENQLIVAHKGRKPGQQLVKGNKQILLQDWAHEIMNLMEPVCNVLDNNTEEKLYSNALARQRQRVENPDLTPSAQVLAGMQETGKPFAPYALDISGQHRELFKNQQFDENELAMCRQLAEESWLRQKEIENNDSLAFDDFLQQYFSQK